MVEIKDCRHCGYCCQDCVFLEYEPKPDLFTCLIYNNKNRIPVYATNVLKMLSPEPIIEYIGLSGKKGDVTELYSDYLLERIEKILTGSEHICDDHVCLSMADFGKIPPSVSKDRDARIKWLKGNITKSREHIPNFDDLIEILNEDVSYTLFIISHEEEK